MMIDHNTREQVEALATAARAAGSEEAPVVQAVCEIVLSGKPSLAAMDALTKQQRDTLNGWVSTPEGWNQHVAMEMCADWLGIPRPKKSCAGAS